MVGTAVASGALTFVLGYWYVRSKIESKLSGFLDFTGEGMTELDDVEDGELF